MLCYKSAAIQYEMYEMSRSDDYSLAAAEPSELTIKERRLLRDLQSSEESRQARAQRTLDKVQQLKRRAPHLSRAQLIEWNDSIENSNLYKRSRTPSFSRNYPFEYISFETYTDGRAELSVYTRHFLNRIFLSELLTPRRTSALSGRSCFHDLRTENNTVPRYGYGARIYFHLNQGDSQDIVTDVFEKVISRLVEVKPIDGIQDQLLENIPVLRKAVHDFLLDFERGFPGPNYMETQVPIVDKIVSDFSENQLALSNAFLISDIKAIALAADKSLIIRLNSRDIIIPLALYRRERAERGLEGSLIVATVFRDVFKFCEVLGEGNVTVLIDFLRQGFNPNLTIFGMPFLRTALGFLRSEVEASSIKLLISDLLAYGADPMFAETGGSNFLEYVVSEFADHHDYPDLAVRIMNYDDSHLSLLDDLIKMTMMIDAGRSHLYVPSSLLDTPIGKLVDAGNKAIALKDSMPAKVYDADLQGTNIHFNTEAGRIVIETKCSDELDEAEREEMLPLFRAEYLKDFEGEGVSDKVAEKALRAYFDNFLAKGEGEGVVLVDLLRIRGEVVGYNIAKVFSSYQSREDGKCYVIHHVRLALAEKAVRQCRRLMTIISFIRGYVIKSLNLDVETTCLSAYGSASRESFLQTATIDSTPMRAMPPAWREVLKFVVYPQKIRDGKMVETEAGIYTRSPLAAAQTNPRHSEFPGRTEHACRVYENHVQMPGYSVAVAFENTRETLVQLARVVDPNLLRRSMMRLYVLFFEKARREAVLRTLPDAAAGSVCKVTAKF